MYRKQDVATHPLSGPPNTLCTSMERPVNVSDEVAKEIQDFVGGCSHHNLQLTTGQAPIGSQGWKWSYKVLKKLKTSLMAPLVLISR